MQTFALRALKPLLVAILLGGLFGQAWIIPFISYEIATDVPDVGAGVVYGVCGIAVVVCIQGSLVAMWRLVDLVGRDAIFSPDAFRWVDLIVRLGWIASALCFVVAGYHAALMPFGPPPVMLFLLGCVTAAVAATLLMIVMRRLLASALASKAELEEVI